MKKYIKKYKTICPLPWLHIGANTAGAGYICCLAEEKNYLKDNKKNPVLWKNFNNIHEYYNIKTYKKIRLQMLNNQRPLQCSYCFDQEDHGIKSIRRQYIDKYRNEMHKLIGMTNKDGTLNNPKIYFLDMEIGNKCNLKCRMCSPTHSYSLGKDWELMDKSFKNDRFERIYKDKWFASPKFFHLLKEVLPSLRVFRMTGGEPMIIKEHEKILEMIIKEGHSNHIWLKYNSNQTVIPKRITELWKYFQKVDVNCSIEGYGELNEYIRYPSKWKNQEKNLYFLDKFSYENKNISIFIHSTIQAYNITRIPELLNYLCKANFKSIFRFPYFIWNITPEWLSPCIYPKSFRIKIANSILRKIDEHEVFFSNYNKEEHKGQFHREWTNKRIKHLRAFCEMIKNKSGQEIFFKEFVKQTKLYDKLRNQSIIKVLPELKHFIDI